MASRDWENLDVFFDPDEFGEEALIHFQDGSTRDIVGIFDEPYVNTQTGEYDMDTVQPRLTTKIADVADVLRGDEVEINGTKYDVLTGPQNDGTGLGMLELAPQA